MVSNAASSAIRTSDGFFDDNELIRYASRILTNRYTDLRTQFTTLSGVYCECFDKSEDRKISIKLIPGEVTADTKGLDDLRREVRACLQLSHPRIARVLSLECIEGLSFVRLDHLSGKPLINIVGEAQKPKVVESIYEQAVAALAYSHGRGMAHGDLRPEVMLLDDEQHLTLIDFGVAGVVSNTLARITGRVPQEARLYSAPEVIRGIARGSASDYYALACILYELITEHPPFFSGDLAQQHLSEIPEPLPERTRKQSPTVVDFVTLGLTKDHEQRKVQIQTLLGPRTTGGRPATPERGRRMALRSRVRRMSWVRRLVNLTLIVIIAFGLGAAAVRGRERLHDRSLLRQLDLEFQKIFAGSVTMGEVDGDPDNPAHLVVLESDYDMSPTEVSVYQFLIFLNDTGAPADGVGGIRHDGKRYGPDLASSLRLPVTGVDWSAANRFCEWLSGIDPRWDYRLPTEAEWERAARYPYAGKIYPWGDTAPGDDTALVKHGDSESGLVPVDEPAYRQSPLGFHFLGNAAEWVSDVYASDYYITTRASLNPAGPPGTGAHVVRGCSFADSLADCRLGARRSESNQPPQEIGFRLVRVPKAQAGVEVAR